MKTNTYKVFILALWSLFITCICCCSLQSDEEDARKFLNWTNKRLSELCTLSNLASWEFNTNITDESQRKSVRFVIYKLLNLFFLINQNNFLKKIRGETLSITF